SGRPVSTWDYKHDRPLVLVFAGGDDALEDAFAERYDDYRRANAEVLVIAPRPPERARPYPVLIDADGSATARYVGSAPAVLVTDAFGVLEGRFDGRDVDHAAIRNLIVRLEM